MAKRNVGHYQFVYAVLVHESFDRKAESKHLRYFISGTEEEFDGMGTKLVAIEKKTFIPTNTLFHMTIGGTTKNEVEERLLESCVPLTIGQRCADICGPLLLHIAYFAPLLGGL